MMQDLVVLAIAFAILAVLIGRRRLAFTKPQKTAAVFALPILLALTEYAAWHPQDRWLGVPVGGIDLALFVDVPIIVWCGTSNGRPFRAFLSISWILCLGLLCLGMYLVITE